MNELPIPEIETVGHSTDSLVDAYSPTTDRYNSDAFYYVWSRFDWKHFLIAWHIQSGGKFWWALPNLMLASWLREIPPLIWNKQKPNNLRPPIMKVSISLQWSWEHTWFNHIRMLIFSSGSVLTNYLVTEPLRLLSKLCARTTATLSSEPLPIFDQPNDRTNYQSDKKLLSILL